MKKFIFLFAIGLFALHPVKAQATNSDTATRNFIIKASIGGLNEISSGQLARQKAVSPAVKSFGNRMVLDHSKAQAKLIALAKANGYQIPPEATGGIMPDLMLKKAEGKDFDRIYVHMMVPDHRSTVALFQNYAITGKDPDIKAFVVQTLPVLKEHLAAVKVIDEQMKDSAN